MATFENNLSSEKDLDNVDNNNEVDDEVNWRTNM